MNSNEFSSLLPWPSKSLENSYDQKARNTGMIPFAVYSLLNLTTYRSRLHIPVYRFQDAAEFPNLNYYKWLGAYHGAETPLVFGSYELLDHVSKTTDFQVEVSHLLQDHVLAFLEDPCGGPEKLGWEPMATSDVYGGFLRRFGGSSGKATERISGNEVDGVCSGAREYETFP
jgi:acetylcholinesterase